MLSCLQTDKRGEYAMNLRETSSAQFLEQDVTVQKTIESPSQQLQPDVKDGFLLTLSIVGSPISTNKLS